jgi:hypothetical protein
VLLSVLWLWTDDKVLCRGGIVGRVLEVEYVLYVFCRNGWLLYASAARG